MLITFFQRAVVQGVPILFGSTGEILTEKSGNLNLGIPGIMYVGGISGVIGAFLYEESLPSRADIRHCPPFSYRYFAVFSVRSSWVLFTAF